MNAIKRKQFTDRLIKFTQSVYKIDLIPPNPPLPVQLSTLFPNENVEEILKKKKQVEQLTSACLFIFDKRYNLIVQINNYITKMKLSNSQSFFLSLIVLRSCCGLLFWELVDIDINKLLVFIKSLCLLVPTAEQQKAIFSEFFTNFTEIIYKLPDIDTIITYLPLINEMMLKHPKICGNNPILHLDTIIKLCHRLEQKCSPQAYHTISVFFKNFSRTIPFCVGIDFNSPKEKKSTEIIQLILQLVPKQATIDILISYLALLMAFHKHDSDTLPLLERISSGFIEDTKTTSNEQQQDPAAASNSQNLSTIYTTPSNYVLSSNQFIDMTDKETFPPGLNFDQIERPIVPNLNGIPPNFSKPSIIAASEMSEHFLTCGSNEFLSFVNIMLNSQSKNILSLMIMMIISLPPHRPTIAQAFVKNDAWSVLFNEQNFSLTENPKSRIVNLKQSIFDLVSFLSIDKAITSSVRVSYCNLLARFAKNPKQSAEILLMSYPQLKEIFSLPNTEDNLADVLMQILLNQQRFQQNILKQGNNSVQRKSIVEYRIQTISIIFKIIKLKEIMLSISSSQFACEALISMMLEKSLESLIEKVVSKLILVASFPKVNHHPFTTALHQMILILINPIKSIELLCHLFKLIEKNSTSILLKSSIMNDIYNVIILCKDTSSSFKYELLELSLKIMKNVKDYVEFDPRIVPFRTIGKVCSVVGLSDTIFQILIDAVINDNIILIPEGVQMLVVASEGTDRANYVLKILIELCKNSTCNRCSCIIGNTPILLISSYKFSPEVFELMRLIFYSIADAQSIWAFMRCFDSDSTTKEGILSLLDIVENASDNVKPLFQFTSVSARLCFPQFQSSSLQNGFFVESSIFIDSKAPGRDFFEFRNNSLRFVVSFVKGAMLYRVESKKGSYSMSIDAEFPVKKWFDISVVIKPSDGITISFDGEIKAGLGVPSFSLGDSNFDCIFFQKTDIAESVEPMQMNAVYISGDFQPDEIDIYDIPSADLIKGHIIYKLTADNIYEGSLTNMQKLSYNAFTIPVASSFFHVFESTYSLKIILSLFRKIARMPSIIDNLIKLVFRLVTHSATLGRQMIECNGFGIMAHFLSKLDSSEITTERWKLLINEAKHLRTEPIIKAFAQDIFYNLNIWIKASTSVQYLVLSEWKRTHLFGDLFQNVPFLLATYEKFMNDADFFKPIHNERRKRGSQSSIKFGSNPPKRSATNTESPSQSENENSKSSDNDNDSLKADLESANSILNEQDQQKQEIEIEIESDNLNEQKQSEEENYNSNESANNEQQIESANNEQQIENVNNEQQIEDNILIYSEKDEQQQEAEIEDNILIDSEKDEQQQEAEIEDNNLNESEENVNLIEPDSNDQQDLVGVDIENSQSESTETTQSEEIKVNDNDSTNATEAENEMANLVENETFSTSDNCIDIDNENGTEPAKPASERVSKSMGFNKFSNLQSSLPSNFYQRSKIRNSISISNTSNEKSIKNYQPIRSLILSMLMNYIHKFKVNIKDARFLYQSLQNCPTPEITLELLDVIEFIIVNNFGELLNIEGSEWLTFFVHKSEAVQIRWLTLFNMLYPTPSPEFTQSILLLLISQPKRKMCDNESSKYSILAAYCKACLYLKEDINLSVICKHQNLCASPQYFNMAVLLAIDAPNRLSDYFVQFVLSLCRTQDNIKRIGEKSTPLTLFILIYWAINRSLRNANNITANNSTCNINLNLNVNDSNAENDAVPNDNFINNNSKPMKSLSIQSIDKNAAKFISLICSESPSLFETAIGIIDSISLITRFELNNFRSLLLSNVFANISKQAARNEGNIKEFIQILCQAVFFHVKIYSFLPLRRLIDESKISPRLPMNKRVLKQPVIFPHLKTLCGMYKEMVPLLDTPLFASAISSSASQQIQPAMSATSSTNIQPLTESSEMTMTMSYSPSFQSTTSIPATEVTTKPIFGSPGNPSIAFSLAYDRSGNWLDRNLVFKLIFFINKMKDDSMRKNLAMLSYFFFRISNFNDSQSVFPIVTALLKGHDAYSFLMIKALMKFKIFSLTKGDDIAKVKPVSQANSGKRKKRRRNSDSTAPPTYISDLKSEKQQVRQKPDNTRSVSIDDTTLPNTKTLSGTSSSPVTHTDAGQKTMQVRKSSLIASPQMIQQIQKQLQENPQQQQQRSPEKPQQRPSQQQQQKPSQPQQQQGQQKTSQPQQQGGQQQPQQKPSQPQQQQQKTSQTQQKTPERQQKASENEKLESFPSHHPERSNTVSTNPLNLTYVVSSCENFIAQNYNSKFLETCMVTLNSFCEDVPPSVLPQTYSSLIKTLIEDSTVLPAGIVPLKFTTTRFDRSMWHKLSHQVFTKNQSHFKRSSFVDCSLRPILLKRNFNFDERLFDNENFASAASIEMNTESSSSSQELLENRVDSVIAPTELAASRVKISKVINGTFYIYPNSSFRFISNEGKLLEIPINDVLSAFPMICLQRQTAVEMVTKQHKSYMFNFTSRNDLMVINQYIKIQWPTSELLSNLTDKWVKRQITNFEYLTSLNAYSGRTFNSAYSYPIFPWILADYSSPQLKLDDPASYRDLSKPIGALNESRLEKLKALRDDNIDNQKFLYRSTYSCSFHVYHYMVRLEPFTSLHIMMQDGKFDVASRLFTSIENSYNRVISTSFNFRELIPEFFFCSEFLVNNDNIPLNSDIENVELPPYAKSPIHFIYLHRQALESEYVSAHLHEWIDLIWGYKQDGQAAEEADNAFDPHLYPNVWKEFPDPEEKEQIEELLKHVGQIPQKLFDSPHPKRSSSSTTPPSFTIGYVQSSSTCPSEICCINRLQWTLHRDGKVYNLKNSLSKKILLEGCGCDASKCAPMKNGFAVARKYSNHVYVITEDIATQQSVKQILIKRTQHLSPITAICTIGNVIYTGDEDGIIVNDVAFSPLYHKCPIVSIVGSSALSVIVSLSADGTIVVSNAYDLQFIRTIKPEMQVGFSPIKVVVCDGFGLISLLSISKDKTKSLIQTFSINGQKVTSSLFNLNIKNFISVVGTNNVDYLLVTADKGKIILYNAFELTLVNTAFENDQNISAIASFKDNNSQIYFGSNDGTFKYGTLSI